MIRTPRPWRRTGFFQIIDGQGGLIAIIGQRENRDERIFNSCLIAAAPDLLEALEEMLSGPYLDCPEETLEKVVAAIKKARGEG